MAKETIQRLEGKTAWISSEMVERLADVLKVRSSVLFADDIEALPERRPDPMQALRILEDTLRKKAGEKDSMISKARPKLKGIQGGRIHDPNETGEDRIKREIQSIIEFLHKLKRGEMPQEISADDELPTTERKRRKRGAD